MDHTDFETRVLPVVAKHARNRFWADEQRQQDVVGNAWYLYQLAPDRLEITATTFARLGVGWVHKARDLPGCGGSGNLLDALDYPNTLRCGSMEGFPDRQPGPAWIAQYRERAAELRQLDGADKTVVEMTLDGFSNNEIAGRLRVTPGAVSQRRERIARRLAR